MLVTQQLKLNIDDIKAVSHTIIIPALLTLATSNILYGVVYLIFITFIYTKVKTETELSDTVQFISKILLTIILTTTTLVLIAVNANFLIRA